VEDAEGKKGKKEEEKANLRKPATPMAMSLWGNKMFSKRKAGRERGKDKKSRSQG
jgi:hypothetical protein